MKDAKAYEQKIKKILTANRPSKRDSKAVDAQDPFAVLVEGVLQADAAPHEVQKAIRAINGEFVDFNELRVAPVKDVVECLGKAFPFARRKAVMLREALNAIYYRVNDMSMKYIEKMQKRALRRHLTEVGLDCYAAGYVALVAFGHRAIPVDQTLVETLAMNGDIPADMSTEEVQKFLERAAGRRNMFGAHLALRRYVEKNAKALAQKRRAEAKARAEAEAKAKAKAKAEAKAKARAEAAKEAKAKAREKTQAKAKVGKKTSPAKGKAKTRKPAAKAKSVKQKTVKKKVAGKQAAKKKSAGKSSGKPAKKRSAREKK